MKFTKRPRAAVAATGALGLALSLAACGGGDDTADAGGGASADGDCAVFEQYGTFDSEEVSMYSPIRDAEADALEE